MMNLWNNNTATTEPNTPMIDSFLSSDQSPFWPPPPTPTPSFSASASTVSSIVDLTKAIPFNQETLQQRLQTLIEGAHEAWTYAIFWQSSVLDYSGSGPNSSSLSWADGYYKGGYDDKGKRKISSPYSPEFIAEQEQRKKVLRELNSLISGQAGPDEGGVDEEVTDTEWFFLISMTQSFGNGSGLPGLALQHSSPVWVAGSHKLGNSSCDRADMRIVLGFRRWCLFLLRTGLLSLVQLG